MLFIRFSVDAVVARYKHEHIVEGLSLREPVSRVSESLLKTKIQNVPSATCSCILADLVLCKTKSAGICFLELQFLNN